MDIEQITYETFDRVDRLDRDLRRHMKKEKTESGSGTTINTTEITSSIKGADDVNLSDVNTKIDGCGTTICGNIKGTDDVDLTLINENINNIKNLNNALINYINLDPLPQVWEDDPYKLDADFTGYTAGETTFNTTDSFEITKPYILNENGNNYAYYLAYVGVYCESETFDVKFTADLNLTDASTLRIECPEGYLDGTTKTYKTISLSAGKNIVCETSTVIVSPKGNWVFFKLPGAGTTVSSVKVEVFGKNVCILNKPQNYKIFSKNGETIISKLENHNGYVLKLDNNKLNPVDLTKDYELYVENIKDFHCIRNHYDYYIDISMIVPGFLCLSIVDLDGYGRQRLDKATNMRKIASSGIFMSNCKAFDLTQKTNLYECFYVGIQGVAGNQLWFSTLNQGSTASVNGLNDTYYLIANFAVVEDNFDVCYLKYNEAKTVQVHKNGHVVLQYSLENQSETIDLGIGRNVSAYYDKTDKNKIYVYMKVGDKMVKKTVEICDNTDENGTVTHSFNIIEQKIIGTYDYYFETPTDKYFVVKNNQLYMFKK